jgi:hypothetical protein
MRDRSCAECLELCPDVALGIADAEERANVLSHVEGCRACRSELASLSEVADLLNVLVPPVEPPPGFASRVADAIAPLSTSASHDPVVRRRYVRPLSVAAAVVIAAALAVGGWLASGGGSAPSVAVQAASFVSGHHDIGQVTMVAGEKPWISVAVHLQGMAVVRCEVENSKGRWGTVGTFDVYSGWGYWAAALPHDFAVRRAELITPNGHVLASASFGPQ